MEFDVFSAENLGLRVFLRWKNSEKSDLFFNSFKEKRFSWWKTVSGKWKKRGIERKENGVSGGDRNDLKG